MIDKINKPMKKTPKRKPTISYNEIKKRAIAFSHEWKDETKERAEAHTFWDAFFPVFGVSRRRVASFEEACKKFGGNTGFIDLYWKGTLIVEHKSKGENLAYAKSQAVSYFNGLTDSELPRYIIVTDFENMNVCDLDTRKETEFKIENLDKYVGLFDFISGYEQQQYVDEGPVNQKAALLTAGVHDALKENGYGNEHDLSLILTRTVFCFFAEHTNIFKDNAFRAFIEETKEDGTNLGTELMNLFELLNTPDEARQKNIDEKRCSSFAYIDGKLFEERISTPAFNSDSRLKLLEACKFDWSKISPAIFGSMFQAVMSKDERHALGAHYTSEKNIRKALNDLFLNDLNEEFKKGYKNVEKLKKLLDKIKKIKILDPACGCGNFLIVAYGDLRKLQVKIHKRIWDLEGKNKNQRLDIYMTFGNDLDVDSMYGIEIQEFPAQIARVGLWLMDHMVNNELSKEFGEYYKRLPLTKTAKIVVGNALRMDWNEVIKNDEVTYIISNPPFVAKKARNKEQGEDLEIVCKGLKNHMLLDYVACWYVKTAEYIHGTSIQVAFVSTKSITQGEQVGILWKHMLKSGVKINFAHRSFLWTNDAKKKASVHVVIIGFSEVEVSLKTIYEYPDVKGEAKLRNVPNINPYLVCAKDILIESRTNPICDVPKMHFGNMPLDGGFLLMSDDEKKAFITKEPSAEKYIKPLISGWEMLNGKNRWCLWLVDAEPAELKKMPEVMKRIEEVRQFRLNSIDKGTNELAKRPTLFRDRNHPKTFIAIPATSSEGRLYLPMIFCNTDAIVSNSCMSIPDATMYLFGVISSEMHMCWMKYVCGRLKSDYRYTKDVVYNNFPFPQYLTEKNHERVGKAASQILEMRAKHATSSLAEMYDPKCMPQDLRKAHKELDKEVDKSYRKKPFKGDTERMEFLFELYEKYIQKEKEEQTPSGN